MLDLVKVYTIFKEKETAAAAAAHFPISPAAAAGFIKFFSTYLYINEEGRRKVCACLTPTPPLLDAAGFTDSQE